MHILHLIKTSQGATWAIRLMEALKKKHPEISFSVLLPKGGKHFGEYEKICENVIVFNYTLSIDIFKNGKKFRRIINELNPDIIHSWFTQTTLYARLFLRGLNIPRLFQVVGPAHLESALFKLGDIKSSQKNDYWIATSKYIYNKYLDSGVDKGRIFLNYAFIDVNSLLHSKDKLVPIDYKKKYNLSKETKVIGTASYIYPPKFYESKGIKGHEYLLDAFELLLKKRNDVILVIAGSTFGSNKNYEEKLKERAKRINPKKIVFIGKYQNVYEVISGFDAFVYLSKSENLGGVYESLLFKIPTIASNKGALPELVIDNQTGFTVEPSDKEALVEKLNLMLESELFSFKSLGKELVMDTFNKNKMIESAYAIYQNVLIK